MKAKAGLKIGTITQPIPKLLCPNAVVLIRTVTHYHVGRVVSVFTVNGTGFVELADAAWVADTGRFSDALKTGNLSEVEPFTGNVLVGLGSIIDIAQFTGTIPLAKK